MDIGNQDLAILLGYKLMRNRQTRLCFVAALEDENRAAAEQFLHNVAALARVPSAAVAVQPGGPEGELRVDPGSVNIIPMADRIDIAAMRRTSERLGTACLFTRDSGEENALA
jgi:hypothetical protein